MKAKQRGSYWFSKISNWLFCPRKYERVHLLGELEPAGRKSGDLMFGKIYHLAMESLVNGGDSFVEVFDVYWEGLQGRDDIAWGRFGWEWLSQMGPRMLRRFKKVYMPRLSPVIVERRMFGSCGEHSFEGTPDVIGYFDGKLSMIDFKTSGYRYDVDKVLVADQLIGYAHLYRDTPEFKQHGEIEQIVYFVFCKDKGSIQTPLILPLTKDVESSIIGNTMAIIDQIEATKAYPMNMSSCIRGPLRCPFFEKCHGEKRK